MHVKSHIVWLSYTLAVAVSVSWGFNIATTTSHISIYPYNTEQKDFFRNKVLQILTGENKGELDPATHQQHGSEEPYQSERKQTHQCLIIPEISHTNKPVAVKEFGLSITEASTHHPLTVCCSIKLVHACYEASNSVCYKMTDHLQQECTKKTVDLVFLFDGSASMTENEFNKNKDFIVDIINSLKNSSIKFAAAQFSTDYRKVFDFNDYQAGTALTKLQNEPHMRSLTNTYRALKFVLEDILDNPGAGASPDATKVLVLITDGDPSDIDRYGILKQYHEKKVIRFVIAVRGAKLDKFTAIASQPTENYAFKIENYDALENVQIQILKGCKVAPAGDMTDEMSQTGHRTVFYSVGSPNVVHACSENSCLNSVCYKMTDHHQPVDLVFLFDGSASMIENEFDKNKDFIVEIINNLKNVSIKFAAAQFSTDYRKVFDFNDYQAGTALSKLQNEPHMRSLTNTYKALKFVLEDILDNPGAGASPDATKVLVLITDGDPSDTDRYGILKQYHEKNIIRFVIAVRGAKLDKFTAIASQPTANYAFKIENYDGLMGILENVQKKMFGMKGCKVSWIRDMTDEMSLSGISAVFYNDTLTFGSVRSNSWRGPLQDIHELKQTQTENPDMQMDSYMGNSVCIGNKKGAPLYFSGAPQFEQKGQVVLFGYDCENWTPAQRLNGEQIGSYFGAELCSVDIDSDGNTDFLLVGAPLFYYPQEKRKGQVYVFTLTEEMKLKSELNVTVSSMGRFGTTISSIADLNGDGLRDVAVGAPLEDENSGAVYIYLGAKHTGIRNTFSQRIVGQQIKPGLKFFGQAIDGDIDLGENGLPDIVIGSQGTAVVLRSRPIFNVLAQLSVEPKEISTETTGCLVNTGEILPMVALTACFEMVETTKSKAGIVSSGLNILYTLEVDPLRQTHRGFTSQTDTNARILASTYTLRQKYTCFNHTIYIQKCVEDRSSPISIRLNFLQVDSERSSVVLNVDSDRQALIEVPFQMKS